MANRDEIYSRPISRKRNAAVKAARKRVSSVRRGIGRRVARAKTAIKRRSPRRRTAKRRR